MTPIFLYVLRVPDKSLGQKMYTQKLNQTVQRSQSPPSCFCIFFSSCCVYHNIKGHWDTASPNKSGILLVRNVEDGYWVPQTSSKVALDDDDFQD